MTKKPTIRPRTSLTSPSNSNGPTPFVFSQTSYSMPEAVESKSANSESTFFVKWGSDNAYPKFIYDLYETTSQFNALVNNLHDYVLGESLSFSRAFPKGDDLNELVDKCVLDLILFNMCAVQRLRNPLGELAGLAYVDIIKLRIGVQDGEPTAYWSDNWSSYTKKYVTVPIDSPESDSDIVIFKARSKSIYPAPLYSGALKSIVILNSVDNYHLNNIKNGFAGSFLMNFNNGVPSKEDQSSIEKKIQDKWCGDKNAGKFILSFNDTQDNAATIEKVPEDSLDTKFETLYSTCKENLLMAFRCPSQLVGITESANAFNNIEYEQSFLLYSRTAVQPMQSQVRGFFEKVTGIQGFLTIEPFQIKFNTEQ